LEKLPQWFIPIIGFIYATGFLLVITFFDQFGLRESSGDFFKIKYLHVGILFWLLPLILMAPLYSAYLMSCFRKDNENNAGNGSYTLNTPTVLLSVNLLFVFYIFAVFAPQGYISKHELIIPIMFTVTIVGITFIRMIIQKLAIAWGLTHRHSDDFQRYAKWGLLLFIVVFLDWYALYDTLDFIWEVFWSGKYVFLFFLTAVIIAERTRDRIQQMKDWRQQYALQVIAVCLIIATYYLSVLMFAIRLYPYIPVSKGGGDYVDAPNVMLCFQEVNAKFILPELLSSPHHNECIKSRPLQIIEESSTSVFVADPDDAGGPKEWRTGKKPKVYEVRKDKVGSIIYLN
jgi:hypothetical protein